MTHWTDHISVDGEQFRFNFSVTLSNLLDMPGTAGLNDEFDRQLDNIGYPFIGSNINYTLQGNDKNSVSIQASFSLEDGNEQKTAQVISWAAQTVEPAILIITPDGTATFKEVTHPPDLKELQRGVGGYIEEIRLPLLEGTRPYLSYVNEEGLLKNLPDNAVVSLLYGETIVGTAVILLNFAYDEEGHVIPA